MQLLAGNINTHLSVANLSATYLSLVTIKLSNNISGVIDQSSRPTAAYSKRTILYCNHSNNNIINMNLVHSKE